MEGELVAKQLRRTLIGDRAIAPASMNGVIWSSPFAKPDQIAAHVPLDRVEDSFVVHEFVGNGLNNWIVRPCNVRICATVDEFPVHSIGKPRHEFSLTPALLKSGEYHTEEKSFAYETRVVYSICLRKRLVALARGLVMFKMTGEDIAELIFGRVVGD